MSTKSERVKNWSRRNPDAARAAQFKSNNGVDLADLPMPPKDGKCELCGWTQKERQLDWDHDHGLEGLGCPKAQCNRGWLCYRCNNMLGNIEAVGIDKMVEYLTRERVAGYGDDHETRTIQNPRKCERSFAARLRTCGLQRRCVLPRLSISLSQKIEARRIGAGLLSL